MSRATSSIAPGFALAQLIIPARRIGDSPVVKAERYIRHGDKDSHEVALACFEYWGLLRKNLSVRCKPVTFADLGMVEFPTGGTDENHSQDH